MVLYLLYTLWLKNYFTLPSFWASPLNLGALVMITDLIFVPIISLFTKKPDMKKVEEMFSCYHKTITVSAEKVLVDDTDEK